MPQDTTSQFFHNGRYSTKASINATVCNVGVDNAVEMVKGILQGAAEELASLLGKRAAFDHLSQMCDDMAKPAVPILSPTPELSGLRAIYMLGEKTQPLKRNRSRKKPI